MAATTTTATAATATTATTATATAAPMTGNCFKPNFYSCSYRA